ncbi:hypothetical protein HGG72_05565 [Ochrobactrum pecoris]|uniref:Uncharacterized protein n=1 Tax=Brucella pecoris TaxID=867683 RepID=A0A5C5CEQ5_9HYPH|nr:hypothetical protein [Brucella pecoris]MBB4094094.1 hypothetical protein [Brucella pecoris]NKW79906.1 hypothetical protein [Brucella pecoris]TNV09465.1 hypothetical protein FIB18_20610 [Brucella pecoris]
MSDTIRDQKLCADLERHLNKKMAQYLAEICDEVMIEHPRADPVAVARTLAVALSSVDVIALTKTITSKSVMTERASA